jgi:hypothetical protein
LLVTWGIDRFAIAIAFGVIFRNDSSELDIALTVVIASAGEHSHAPLQVIPELVVTRDSASGHTCETPKVAIHDLLETLHRIVVVVIIKTAQWWSDSRSEDASCSLH